MTNSRTKHKGETAEQRAGRQAAHEQLLADQAVQGRTPRVCLAAVRVRCPDGHEFATQAAGGSLARCPACCGAGNRAKRVVVPWRDGEPGSAVVVCAGCGAPGREGTYAALTVTVPGGKRPQVALAWACSPVCAAEAAEAGRRNRRAGGGVEALMRSVPRGRKDGGIKEV
jgi:hypothetical protein